MLLGPLPRLEADVRPPYYIIVPNESRSERYSFLTFFCFPLPKTISWDEWVPESRALKLNEANLAKQASLKESYPGKKKTVPKTSTSTESSDRGKKRAKDTSVDKEEDFTKRPEIKVPIPDSLKAQLVDDWENITKNQQVRTPLFFIGALKENDLIVVMPVVKPRPKPMFDFLSLFFFLAGPFAKDAQCGRDSGNVPGFQKGQEGVSRRHIFMPKETSPARILGEHCLTFLLNLRPIIEKAMKSCRRFWRASKHTSIGV